MYKRIGLQDLHAEDLAFRNRNKLHFTICMRIKRTLPLYSSLIVLFFYSQQKDKKRSIMHLHFKDWPDHDVPEDFDPMIHFCQIMRRHIASNKGLTVVHCRYLKPLYHSYFRWPSILKKKMFKSLQSFLLNSYPLLDLFFATRT